MTCLFVSLLSHFRLIHLFYLHLLYQLNVGLCQATCVQSHQRQSTSAAAIATCEVQASTAYYQTVPTVATGVLKPLCCRLNLTFTLTSENLSLYITLFLTGRYTTMQPTLLTSWLQLLLYKVQGVDNHSWGLYCRRCYCTCVCWSFQSDIPLFTLTTMTTAI